MEERAPALRVAFLGNATWSVPSLEAVAASRHPVALVVTRDARPAGRGHGLRRTAVAAAADRLGLDLLEVASVKGAGATEMLADASADVLAVVAYGEILPAALLEIPRLLPVNVHFSLLPRWRGAAPVQRAILAGDRVTGVTTMRMTEGLDEGPVLLHAETEIGPGDDAGTLGERLAEMGGRLLVATLDGLASRAVPEHPQDDDRATFAPKLTRDERRIDWSRHGEEIVRRVRAFAPEPGAVATFRGTNLKVLRAAVVRDDAQPASGDAGRIVIVDGGPHVACGSGLVALLDVAPEGRRRMTGEEFARGYRPGPDDVLT